MVFFFFKQKTAYEIKECDWSSDVCSSDLCFEIHSPSRSPHFSMVGQIALLPGTRSDGREAFVHADERAPCKIIACAIAEKLPSAGGVPEPFAPCAQVLQRNNAGAEFRDHRNLDFLTAEYKNLESLFPPCGAMEAYYIHGVI